MNRYVHTTALRTSLHPDYVRLPQAGKLHGLYMRPFYLPYSLPHEISFQKLSSRARLFNKRGSEREVYFFFPCEAGPARAIPLHWNLPKPKRLKLLRVTL
jgi:hypothetical protein